MNEEKKLMKTWMNEWKITNKNMNEWKITNENMNELMKKNVPSIIWIN